MENDYAAYLKKHQGKIVTLSRVQEKELARMYIEFAGKIKASLADITSAAQLAQQKIVMNKLIAEAARLSNNFSRFLDKSLLEAANLSVEANRYMLKGYQQALFDKGYSVELNKVLWGVPKAAVETIYSRIWEDGLKLSDRVWKLKHGTQGQIERIVMEAIITGKPASDPMLTNTLMGMFNPEYKGKLTTLHGRKVWYEATRLLRTARTEAFAEADRMGYKANPGVKKVNWHTSNDDRTCDICLARDGEDVEWVGYPPAHPNCRCTTVPEVESVDKFVDRFIGFMQNPSSQPDLSQWYSQYIKKAA